MREIKFRIWDENNRKFLKTFFIGNHPIFNLNNKGELGYLDDLTEGQSLKFIFQQFTGLKDKNGREIYEGDILVSFGFPTEKYECKFSVRHVTAAFHLENIRKGWDFGGKTSDYIEIIGNIFENPELLKKN